ncbi:MAG: immunoglobulin domain-containing protein [Oscillospiraceae bacterium]|nr:immunoglobulin domain-containing protein [Oscillospiraceae bacterium]
MRKRLLSILLTLVLVMTLLPAVALPAAAEQSDTGVEITKQPSDAYRFVGADATFTVEAEGNGLTYQWLYVDRSGTTEVNRAIEGETSPTLVLENVDMSMSRNQYRCAITSSDAPNLFELSDKATLYFTTDVGSGTLRITGGQYDTEVGGHIAAALWENVNTGAIAVMGENANEYGAVFDLDKDGTADIEYYTLTPTQDSGLWFYFAQHVTCSVTSHITLTAGGAPRFSWFDDQALSSLLIMYFPNITSQPHSVVWFPGTVATYSVEAEGECLTYQWYTWDVTGAEVPIEDATEDTLYLPVTEEMNGSRYYCRVGTTLDPEVYTESNRATLYVATDAGAGTLDLSDGNELVFERDEGADYVGVIEWHAYELGDIDVSGDIEQGVLVDLDQNGAADLMYRYELDENQNMLWFFSRCDTYSLAETTLTADGFGIAPWEDNKGYSTLNILLLSGPPVINVQTEDMTVTAGSTAVFGVEATGADSYQWQYSKNGGSTWSNCSCQEPTFVFTAKANYNGWQYRCKVTNAYGSTTSIPVTLTVVAPPAITAQPADQTVAAGETVTFTVAATGADSYQWQYSKNGGATWMNSPTGKAATFSFTATAAMNGRMYRCIVTNGAGDTPSNAATLTVASKPVITTQPTSQSVNAGETVTFTVAATGAESYQWQYSKNGGATWTNSASVSGKKAAFSFKASAEMNGRMYRCIVTNGAGSTTSSAATLTVATKPVITSQPADQTVNVGETVTFAVTATGAESYQWQYSKNGGSTWLNSASVNGRKAAFSFKTSAAMDGRMYRCVVTNGAGSTTSSAATLTVVSKPVITSQPVSQSVNAGETVTFTVAASGAESYQWQYSKNGGATWTNSASVNGRKAAFSFKASAEMNGRMYRCIVTNGAGDTTSNAATLTVLSKPRITAQPASQTVTAGETVTFTVTAAGAESYQWQYSKNGGATWANNSATGSNTNTFSFKTTAAMNGRMYRCVVTNSAGDTTSNAATLTVLSKPKITAQPTPQTVNAGETVSFSVTATGAESYQWQYSKDNGSTWLNSTSSSGKKAVFTFTATTAMNGRQYRCVVTNGVGDTTSNAATLTVIIRESDPDRNTTEELPFLG